MKTNLKRILPLLLAFGVLTSDLLGMKVNKQFAGVSITQKGKIYDYNKIVRLDDGVIKIYESEKLLIALDLNNNNLDEAVKGPVIDLMRLYNSECLIDTDDFTIENIALKEEKSNLINRIRDYDDNPDDNFETAFSDSMYIEKLEKKAQSIVSCLNDKQKQNLKRIAKFLIKLTIKFDLEFDKLFENLSEIEFEQYIQDDGLTFYKDDRTIIEIDDDSSPTQNYEEDISYRVTKPLFSLFGISGICDFVFHMSSLDKENNLYKLRLDIWKSLLDDLKDLGKVAYQGARSNNDYDDQEEDVKALTEDECHLSKEFWIQQKSQLDNINAKILQDII